MGLEWAVNTQNTELSTMAECFGFFKAYDAADDAEPLWLTSYGKEVGGSMPDVYGFVNVGGDFVAKPAAITRGPITRTMDPRDTACEVTVEGLAGAHQILLKALNNNYICVIMLQDVSGCNTGQLLLIGEGVPTAYDGNGLSIVIREDRRILDRLLPDVVYQKMCNNVLFGRRCGLNYADYSVTLQWGDLAKPVISNYWAGHTHWEVHHPAIAAFGANYFWLGQIVVGDWSSHERRLINWCEDDGIAFAPAFDRHIDDGESVIIAPGCDKSIDTCMGRFGNSMNFLGFPELPTKNPATQGMF